MNMSKLDIDQLVSYINDDLKKDKNISVNKLCDKLGIKKSTLKSKMSKHNFSYDINLRQYIKNNNNTCSTTTVNEPNVDFKPIEITEISCNTTNSTTRSTTINTDNIDMEKLSILIDNFDLIMQKLAIKNNNITCSTTNTKVTSLRINEEIYHLVKERASKEKSSISDIVNRALLDYLNNYIN
ncbi:MAG: DUF4250 family protein [Sarcina sp.]